MLKPIPYCTKKAELRVDYSDFFENKVCIEKLKWNGEQGIGCCPLPSHDDIHPSFSFNVESGLWNCHGCRQSGNAYTLAKILEMPNPNQYLDIPSTLMKNGHNESIRPPKTEIKRTDEIAMKQAKYTSQLPNDIKDKLDSGEHLGMDDSGRLTFHYPNGIKYHKGKNGEKPYWEGDGHCQIFMEERLTDYPADKPLYIFEGEKDAIVSPSKGISFSAGARNIPKDITILFKHGTIIIVYDHDKPGQDGANKLAERIKKESPDTIVKIAKWDESLPKGYDVYDDAKVEKPFEEFENAIANATEYNLPTPTHIGEFRFMTGEEMDNATPDPLEWYVEGILPKRFNSILAGTTGAKKSMFAMQLGLSLANAEKEFLDGKITGAYKVLYVDTEAGENEVTRRYQAITRKMNNWHGSNNWRMLSKNGSFYDVWDNLLTSLKYFTPDLMIIDCLYNSTSVNEFSKASPVANVTNALCEFKTNRGIDTLAVHHFIKGKHDTFVIDRMVGANALQNWIEWCLLMVKTNRKGLNMLRQGKSRGAPEDNKIYGVRWDDFWFTMQGVINDIAPFMIDNHVKLKYTSIIEDLPERFDNKDWLNVFNQKFSDLSERTGYEWLKDAVASKLIKKITRGVYEKYLQIIDENNVDDF